MTLLCLSEFSRCISAYQDITCPLTFKSHSPILLVKYCFYPADPKDAHNKPFIYLTVLKVDKFYMTTGAQLYKSISLALVYR